MSRSSSTPSRSSSRAATTAVAAACGSIRRTDPKPGLDAWWSIMIQLGAAAQRWRQLAEPAQARRVEADRQVGLGRRRRPGARAGPARAGTGTARPARTAPGSVANTWVKPNWRSPSPNPSMLPSASPSGFTWHDQQHRRVPVEPGDGLGRPGELARRVWTVRPGSPRPRSPTLAHASSSRARPSLVHRRSSSSPPGTAARRRRSVAPAASSCTLASDSRAAASRSSMCLTVSCTSSWTKVERRRVLEPERLAHGAAQQPLGAVQRGRRGRLLGDIAEHRVVDGGLAQVRR